MTKGVLHILVEQRTYALGSRYTDKWNKIDKLTMKNFITDMGERAYIVESERLLLGRWMITRDELAFVKLIANVYGCGDYCIRTWGKGKRKRGIRTFWDGVIANNGKFIRRKEIKMGEIDKGIFDRESMAINPEQMVSRYLKTKRPGQWHQYV